VSLPSAAGAATAAPASPTTARRRAKRRAAWRRRGTVALFLSPWIVGFGVFFGYPIVWSAYLSFTHYDLLNPPKWIGLANYRYLFNGDPQVWPAIRNTLWLVVFLVPCQVLFAFGMAVLLTRARWGIGFFRTVFYLPSLVPPVAATLAFVYVFNPATGPVNTILGHLGIEGPLWFNDPAWSKPSLSLLALWGIGNTMIIFLAAVLDVPKHLDESAQLDGAGWFRRLRWVMVPSISPVILFSLVLAVIQALQYFTQAYVAASVAAGQASQAGSVSTLELGYPEGSTLFYPVLLYYHGFRFFNMGYAAAMAMLMLGVAFLITLVIIRNSRRWVHYAGAVR
jgi:multiple sugar transport system permease protein